MKKYLLTDMAAGLVLLATICILGFSWMNWKTKQIEQELKQAYLLGTPAEQVKKRLRTEAEKTMFERTQKHTE